MQWIVLLVVAQFMFLLQLVWLRLLLADFRHESAANHESLMFEIEALQDQIEAAALEGSGVEWKDTDAGGGVRVRELVAKRQETISATFGGEPS